MLGLVTAELQRRAVFTIFLLQLAVGWSLFSKQLLWENWFYFRNTISSTIEYIVFMKIVTYYRPLPSELTSWNWVQKDSPNPKFPWKAPAQLPSPHTSHPPPPHIYTSQIHSSPTVTHLPPPPPHTHPHTQTSHNGSPPTITYISTLTTLMCHAACPVSNGFYHYIDRSMSMPISWSMAPSKYQIWYHRLYCNTSWFIQLQVPPASTYHAGFYTIRLLSRHGWVFYIFMTEVYEWGYCHSVLRWC